MDTTIRNADTADMVSVLRTQRAARHDLVVPAAAITAQDGHLTVAGDRQGIIDETGVANIQPLYRPTDVAEDGISSKLGIQRAYLRRLRAEHVELWDANVNGWLRHDSLADRKLLVRTFRDDNDGSGGVARAVLTDGYKPIENLDVLVAALEGIRESGATVDIDRCDLSERRMYVTVHSPEVAVMAPRLLDGYRGPWHVDGLAAQRVTRNDRGDVGAMLDLARREGMGYEPGTEPVVFAGFELRNSDVGCGAFELAPKLQVKVCRNGLTMDVGRMRKVHLGARLDEGAIDWSSRTTDAQLALITSQTKDAVTTFLSEGHVADLVRTLEERAGVAVTEPTETIKTVTKRLAYDDEIADRVLAHFIAGGQSTAGGVMQAVTSVAQTVADADRAAAMEGDALRALELAATAAR